MEGRCGTKGTSMRFTRWTFYLIGGPAAIRSGNNSLGMVLSNCKSLLLLRDTGYPWMTWSLIAPIVSHAKPIVLICPGKRRRWIEGLKRKVGDFQPATPAPHLCSISGCCMHGWVLAWDAVRSLQGHLLLQLWLLHPILPTAVEGTGHHWLKSQTSPWDHRT